MSVSLMLFVTTIILCSASSFADFPNLEISGFAWAENLAFDGLGNLFVSEAVRGELWRIKLSVDGSKYDASIYLDRGVNQFGGLCVTPDGKKIYAGVTLADKSYAIIAASTLADIGTFHVVKKTKHQPNGMACDWATNFIYYTDEGTSSDIGGALYAVNLTSFEEAVVYDHINGVDGLWLDDEAGKLYVAFLVSRKILVFDTSKSGAILQGEFIGLNEAIKLPHIIDDITIFSSGTEVADTMLLAADWTGKALRLFSVDGKNSSVVNPPEGVNFKELTSVRWGKGPGFDPNSVYVTEGGGIIGRETDRRVIQVKLR